MADCQHFECVQQSQDNVGQHLAHHQFPRADGGNNQLLDRTALTLTDNGSSGQDGSNGKQDHADHAGDHEVGTNQIRVVPDLCADLDRRLEDDRFAAAGDALLQDIGGIVLTDQPGR